MSSRSYVFNYFEEIGPKGFKNAYMFRCCTYHIRYFQTQKEYQVLKVHVNAFQYQGFEGKFFSKGVLMWSNDKV